MILQLLFCWKSWGCFLGQPRDTPVHSHADTWQRSRWAVRAVYVHIKANYHAGVLVLTWTSDWCSCLLSLISREVTVHPQRRLMKYVAWLGQFHDASIHVENPTESGWPQIANLLIYFVEEATSILSHAFIWITQMNFTNWIANDVKLLVMIGGLHNLDRGGKTLLAFHVHNNTSLWSTSLHDRFGTQHLYWRPIIPNSCMASCQVDDLQKSKYVGYTVVAYLVGNIYGSQWHNQINHVTYISTKTITHWTPQVLIKTLGRYIIFRDRPLIVLRFQSWYHASIYSV